MTGTRREESSRIAAPEQRVRCASCGDEVVGEPLRKKGKVYCCEACAFEGQRSGACNPDRIVYHGSRYD